LLNRRHFMEMAGTEFELSIRQNCALTMLIADIDHFKRVNDHYGHDVGDKVIVAVAQVCRRIARTTDMAARLGGEEFGVLLPNTSQDDAIRIAERLRTAVSEIRIPVHDGDLRVTVSVGVGGRAPSEEADITQLMKHADLALYEAKGGGRNRVCRFEVVHADG